MTRKAGAGAGAASMRGYALQQTRTMLRRLAFQVNQTARQCDTEAVHDLRVAIRRFAQCLRLFEPYFPEGEARKIRHKLKRIMTAAAAVRDRDIAADLLQAAGIPKQAAVMAAIQQQRQQSVHELMDIIRRARHNSFSRQWRLKLGL
jgi:CHAD domain-containing protein